MELVLYQGTTFREPKWLPEDKRGQRGKLPGRTVLSESCNSEGYFFACSKRLAISAQFTTFHQAAKYSGRRFWYFR